MLRLPRPQALSFAILTILIHSACASTEGRRAGPAPASATASSGRIKKEPPEDGEAARIADQGAPERFYLKPFHAIIRQHRELGTHIDGPRCPMYPSCSAYADRIIREDGFTGLLLFIDRLFYREFGRLSDRYMLAPRRLSKSPRYYDPVSDVLPGLDGDQRPAGRPSFFRENFRN